MEKEFKNKNFLQKNSQNNSSFQYNSKSNSFQKNSSSYSYSNSQNNSSSHSHSQFQNNSQNNSQHRFQQQNSQSHSHSYFQNNSQRNSQQQHFQQNYSQQNSQQQQQQQNINFLSLNSLNLNTKYYGIITAIINKSNYIGLYCKFGLNEFNIFEKDGFIKNIIKNKNNNFFRKGDIVEVICINKNPIQLVLLPEYVRPLLILDVNGPLGNRAPFDGNLGRRVFVTRKYTEEFLSLCSQYYEIAVWSCAKKNNIELELFSNINLYFIWSQEESTSLYPRTSFISPAKVIYLDFIILIHNLFE